MGGKWRRTKISVPPDVRPTLGRIRKTLFDWLGNCCQGLRCLDLFAGTGILGFEAASRGATEVVFVDSNQLAINNIVKTQKKLVDTSTFRFYCVDALFFLKGIRPLDFDLIFLDPPFSKFRKKNLEKLLFETQKILNKTGLVYLESYCNIDAETLTKANLVKYKESHTGRIRYQLCTKVSN